MDDRDPETGSIDAVFAALSDPTRRALLERMATAGPVTSSQLAVGSPITRQAISKHLVALEQSGLARSAVAGRERRYEIVPDGLDVAESWIMRAERRWADRLRALKTFVEESPEDDRGE